MEIILNFFMSLKFIQLIPNFRFMYSKNKTVSPSIIENCDDSFETDNLLFVLT